MDAEDLNVRFVAKPEIDGKTLNLLFSEAWSDHKARDFAPVLARSLTYVCAFVGDRLVGFVNLAWDGGAHAFLLDATVHPAFRRRGIGTALIGEATSTARDRGVTWLHVDFEPHLDHFYSRCGFQPTSAGVIKLTDQDAG